MKKKKTIKKEQQKKAQIHISLENPVENRRLILTCALDTAHLLKDFSELQNIREKRAKTEKRLERVLKEIKSLERQLSALHLPEFKEAVPQIFPVHIVPKEKLHPEAEAQPVEKPKKPVKEKTEAEKLKDELKEIEEKLKAL